MLKSTKYRDFLDRNKNSKISEYAFQSFIDMITLNIMSLEYEHDALTNKILSSFGDSEGTLKTFSSQAQLNVGGLKSWITTEYNYLRKKNLIIHLNTIFENYLYNFSKKWIEENPTILDKRTVTVKEVKEMDKTDIIHEKTDLYIQDLLFGNYSKAFKQMKERLSADLQIPSTEVAKLEEFYEIRNVLVHSNGIISTKLAKISPQYKIGDQILLSDQYIEEAGLFISELLTHIDNYLQRIFPDMKTKDFAELQAVSVTYYYT